MAYLLEILGRGLVSSLRGALSDRLAPDDQANVQELRARLRRDPADDETRLMLGLKLLADEDFLPASECFELVLENDDEKVLALLGLACVHDELGRTEKTLEQLNQVRNIEIMDPAILFCIGFCHERLDQPDDALNAYRASLRVCPDLRNSHERLAAIFLKQGNYHQAQLHYEKLVDIDPENMPDRLLLATLCLKVGQHQEASKHYEMAIALDPDNWEIQDDLVTEYEQAGLYQEAIEQLQQMIREQPDFADNHLRLGELYTKVGWDDAALVEFQRSLDIQPEYLEVMVRMGTTHLRIGQYVEAAQWFNRAVEINDRLLTACVGLGVAQLQSGRTQEGLTSFELASKIEPNSTLLFSETARMQLKASLGDQVEKYLGFNAADTGPRNGAELASMMVDKQIERHRQAISEHPDHADLHYRLGLLLKNRGKLDDAATAFRQAVEINPVYEKALVKLGLTLRECDHIDEAVVIFKRALEIQPTDAQLHYQLGLLFAEKHLFELAVDFFHKAQTGMPNNLDLQANLGLALQNTGLLDRAEISWRTTCSLDAYSAGAQSNSN